LESENLELLIFVSGFLCFRFQVLKCGKLIVMLLFLFYLFQVSGFTFQQLETKKT